MKANSLITIFAAAAMLAACSSEMDTPTTADETQSTVTFTAQLPGGMSRAYGDGTTAKVLTYAVYDDAGKLLPKLTGSATFKDLSTSVAITLINGKTYDIVFWAASPNSPYKFDAKTATVTADYYSAVANDENLDAFYKKATVTVDGSNTVSVTLRRPFAQLNIGTSDLALAKTAGYNNEKISVTVTGVNTEFNLLTGKVAGDPTTVTFDYGSLPDDSETFPISGYDYLAMNYIFVGSDDTTANVSFSIYGYNDDNAFNNVPLKANYRTNIYGTLLTNQSLYFVNINPTFQNITYKGTAYETLEDAIAALDPNGTAEENTIKLVNVNYDIDSWSHGFHLPYCNCTIEGDEQGETVVLNLMSKSYLTNSMPHEYVFRNLTLNFPDTNSQCSFDPYGPLLMDHCKLNGYVYMSFPLSTYPASFTYCEFTPTKNLYAFTFHNYWSDVNFSNCIFRNPIELAPGTTQNTEWHCDYTFNDCNFYYSLPNQKALISAGIVLNSTLVASGNLTINNCTAEGFDHGLWYESDGNVPGGTNNKYTVIVDGVTQ